MKRSPVILNFIINIRMYIFWIINQKEFFCLICAIILHRVNKLLTDLLLFQEFIFEGILMLYLMLLLALYLLFFTFLGKYFPITSSFLKNIFAGLYFLLILWCFYFYFCGVLFYWGCFLITSSASTCRIIRYFTFSKRSNSWLKISLSLFKLLGFFYN